MKKIKKTLAIALAATGMLAISMAGATVLDRPDRENVGHSMPIGGEPTCVAPGFTCDGNG